MLNKKAYSIIEYVVMVVIIIGVFLMMSPTVQRGIFGLWQQSGQTFAYGRQFDSQKTVDCTFDEISNTWYDHNCAQSNCPALDSGCIEGLITARTCSVSYCTQLNN